MLDFLFAKPGNYFRLRKSFTKIACFFDARGKVSGFGSYPNVFGQSGILTRPLRVSYLIASRNPPLRNRAKCTIYIYIYCAFIPNAVF